MNQLKNNQMKAFSMSVDDVIRQLETTVEKRLDEARVESLREQYGWNQLADARTEPT